MKQGSIRTRILLGMTAGVALVALLSTAVLEGLLHQFLRSEVSSSLLRAKVAFARFDETRGRFLLDQAHSLAQVPHLRALLSTPDADAETFAYTLQTLREVTDVPLIVVTDSNGLVLGDTLDAASGVGTPANGELDSGALEGVLLGDDMLAVSFYRGQAYLTAACPLTIGGTVLGAIGLGIPLDGEAADTLRGVTGLDVTLLDGERVIARSWVDHATPSEARETIQDLFGEASIGSNTVVQSRLVKGDVVACRIPLEAGTSLVLSRSTAQLTAPFRRAERTVLLFGLAIMGVAIALSHVLSGRIARPILSLSSAVDELAASSLSSKVRVEGPREVMDLAGSFNRMAARISALLAETLQKAEDAEAASRAKSAFLSVMSHEVRTPLNGVLGLSEQLGEEALDPHQASLVEGVQHCGQDLLRLLDDVLEYSNLESGGLELVLSRMNVKAVLGRVTDVLREHAEAKGLSLTWTVDSRVPARIVGPADRIQQVLRYFLENAIKYTQVGAVSVHVSMEEAEQDEGDDFRLRWEVCDTGVGIPAEAQERLFQPFSRLDSSYSREHEGAGLGLALCSILIEKMGGRRGVTSEPGKGSTFWFTLPSSAEPSIESEQQDAADPPPALPSKESAAPLALPVDSSSRANQNILIVEDNRVNQRVTALVLRKAGWPHVVVENGVEALDRLAAEHFDLVLMDCQMPVMDGLEATRRIRAGVKGIPPDLLILALTANTTADDCAACREVGMDDVIAKPVSAASLVATLDRWLATTATSE